MDETKYDRYNLLAWKRDFTQWLRDQRKKYRKLGYDFDCPFLLVPELHQNGAWHMHGLFGDISMCLIPFFCERQQGLHLPDDLVDRGFLIGLITAVNLASVLLPGFKINLLLLFTFQSISLRIFKVLVILLGFIVIYLREAFNVHLYMVVFMVVVTI